MKTINLKQHVFQRAQLRLLGKGLAIGSLLLLGCIDSASAAINCSVNQKGSWNGGYQIDVTLTNTGTAVSSWAVELNYAQNAVITNSWNATISGSGSKKIIATNLSFNGDLNSHASATFGLTGVSTAGFILPTCTVLGGTAISSARSSSSSSTTSKRTDVLNVNFQSQTAGTYTAQKLFADFKGVDRTWNDGIDEGRAQILNDNGNKLLRVTYPANVYGPAKGGVQFVVPFVKSYRDLYFSYRVRFASNFNFVKGGKLPGLTGGLAPTGCISGAGGFSARNMWRVNGDIVQYLYYPTKVNDCGDDFYYTSNTTNVKFTPGIWNTVEHHLVMNTSGLNDGVLQAWVNGQLVLNKHDFLFRGKNDYFGIENLYFSTFFGGNGQDWAPTTQQMADFDDLVVSEYPITHQ